MWTDFKGDKITNDDFLKFYLTIPRTLHTECITSQLVLKSCPLIEIQIMITAIDITCVERKIPILPLFSLRAPVIIFDPIN